MGKPVIEMLERDDVPTVAEKQDLPELLAWAIKPDRKLHDSRAPIYVQPAIWLAKGEQE
jgi:hypothetical protein